MKDWITWLTLTGLILGAIIRADTRYATADEVLSIKRLYQHSERRALKQEEFNLLNEQDDRKLTRREKERLNQVQEELKDIEKDLNPIPRSK